MQRLLAQPIIDAWKQANPVQPGQPPKAGLAIILVGNDPASRTYVELKEQEGASYGVSVKTYYFSDSVTDETIVATIEQLNNDPTTRGILVQLPLPAGHDRIKILNAIAPNKDVDALTDTSPFVSPMPQALDALISSYQLNLQEKKICVVGQGHVTGRPIKAWLDRQSLDYDIVDKTTDNKHELIRRSDVVFSGTGQANLISGHNTREGQIIFDCSGVDVDEAAVENKVAALAPPKGAVGPLVVHFLLLNVLRATRRPM